MKPPLSGYRVLNLSDEKGALCGKILADMGADVIKIEPLKGDTQRSIGPFVHNKVSQESSLWWLAYHSNQKSITLNIETIDGQEIFKKLVKGSHFVVESFFPGYMDKLALNYSNLSQINSSIILTSITPFGQEGPYKHWKGSDIVISAMGGSMYVQGDTDRPPLRIGGVEQSYLVASAYAAAGTMIAHYYRVINGKGQHVDVSAQESVAMTTLSYYQYQDLQGYVFRRTGNYYDRYGKRVQLIWPCKDGYISWRLFMGELGVLTGRVVEWMDSEGKAPAELKKVKWGKIGYEMITYEDYNRWTNIFAEFFKTHTKSEFQRAASERGFSGFPVNTPKDVFENGQLAARDYWVKIEYPEICATILHPGYLYKSSEIKWRAPRRAPLLGEHNDEIYSKELGFSKEELCLLREANII